MKFRLIILLLSLLIASSATMTQPVLGLQRTIGGGLEDNFTCMFITRDSSLVIGGYSKSNKSSDKSENSKGREDFWILMLNNKGAIMWQKTIGGSDADYLESIQPTIDGGYILGGYSLSNISGDKTAACRGSFDYWIVKLDNNFNIQWDKTFGGVNTDILTTVKQTRDGGYLLGGYSESDISGDKTEASRGTFDYWILKLDNAGNIQWDKTIGGSSEDRLDNIIETTDNGFFLGGSSPSGISGEKTEVSRGSFDYWIVKLDNAGNIQWDKTIGGKSDDQLNAIQQTDNGGYILGGTSISNKYGQKMQNSRGGYDYWIVKTDNLGEIEWSYTYGGNFSDFLTSMELTSDGGFLLGGYSTSDISGEKTEPSSATDFWLIKLNKSGGLQWDKTIAGLQMDTAPIAMELEKKRYIVGGSSASNIGRDKTQNNKGVYPTNDYWLVELRYLKPDSIIVAATQKNMLVAPDKTNAGFSVYPNPATNVLHINTTGKTSISLSDQSGKIILTKVINNSGTINIAHLPAGIYYLENIETKETEKILISK